GRAPVRNRYSLQTWYADGTRNAGDHSRFNTEPAGIFNLLVTPSKNEGIATFQPDHMPMRKGIAHQHFIDLRLRTGVFVRPLAHIYLVLRLRAILQKIVTYHRVVQNDIRLRQCFEPPQTDQIGSTRTRTYHGYF